MTTDPQDGEFVLIPVPDSIQRPEDTLMDERGNMMVSPLVPNT